MVTTSKDHGTLEAMKAALPAFMTNHYDVSTNVAVMEDPNAENTISRWLQSCAWEADKALT